MLYAAIETLDAGLEAFDDLANAAHLVEFHLELVDLAQDGAEAGDFGVGGLDRVTGAVVLELCGRLRLLRELGLSVCMPTATIVSRKENSRRAIAAGSSTSDGQSGR